MQKLDAIKVEPMRPEHAGQLEELQRIVFPTLAADELIRAEHYLRHLEVFAKGQWVVTAEGRAVAEAGAGPVKGRDAEVGRRGEGDGGEVLGADGGEGGRQVIGMTSTMRSGFDFADYHHTFKEMIGGGWMTKHDPAGDWLYGLDMGVHPDWRGRGLARLLYRARQAVVSELGLKGQLTVGMLSGYGEVSGQMSGEEYYSQLLAGKRIDPTISAQMKIGFEPAGLIADYLNDPVCGNFGVLLRLDAGTEV